MRRIARAALAGFLLLGAMGASHCEEGDDLAFGAATCFATNGGAGGLRRALPSTVVEARRWYGGLFPPAEVRVEVTACGASVTWIAGGMAETRGPIRVAAGEVRALHGALAAAGAGELVGYTDCLASTGHDTRTEVTFIEPSLVPGRAWANRFGFGNCALEPRAEEVVRVLSAWVNERFGAGSL
jgi:hypothetical protein